jgi:hypothetical protein
MAAVAAAAITAAVAVGTTAYSASQQGAAARGAKGQPSKVPLPPYATALNQDVARVIALNMGQTPPSFAQYVASGGTAKFPFIDPGLSPRQRQQLGLVGTSNQPVPFQPRATSTQPLNLQQLLFEGSRRLAASHGSATDPIAQLARATNRLNKLQQDSQTAQRQRREGRLGTRIGKLESRLGVGNGSTG